MKRRAWLETYENWGGKVSHDERGADHVNKPLAMTRQSARKAALVAGNYGAPLSGGNVTIVSAPRNSSRLRHPAGPARHPNRLQPWLMSTGAGWGWVGTTPSTRHSSPPAEHGWRHQRVPAKPMSSISWRKRSGQGRHAVDER